MEEFKENLPALKLGSFPVFQNSFRGTAHISMSFLAPLMTSRSYIPVSSSQRHHSSSRLHDGFVA